MLANGRRPSCRPIFAPLVRVLSGLDARLNLFVPQELEVLMQIVSTVYEHPNDESRQRARCLTNERHQILAVVRAFVRDDDRGDGHCTDINGDMHLYPTAVDVPLLPQPLASFRNLDTGRVNGQYMLRRAGGIGRSASSLESRSRNVVKSGASEPGARPGARNAPCAVRSEMCQTSICSEPSGPMN